MTSTISSSTRTRPGRHLPAAAPPSRLERRHRGQSRGGGDQARPSADRSSPSWTELPDGDGLDVLRVARASEFRSSSPLATGQRRRAGSRWRKAPRLPRQDPSPRRICWSSFEGRSATPRARRPRRRTERRSATPRGPAYSTEASMTANRDLTCPPRHDPSRPWPVLRRGRGSAVIGASADHTKGGRQRSPANLKAAGFSGRLVVVNTVRPVVQGLPGRWPSILDVDDPIDLAVLGGAGVRQCCLPSSSASPRVSRPPS